MIIVRDILSLLWEVWGCIVPSVLRLIVKPAEKNVQNEICLITGAAGRQGKHFALEFAKKGATLVLWDVDAEGNENTAQAARKLGVRVHAYICDVSKRQQVYQVAERVKQEVGDVTILINNARVVTGGSFLRCDDDVLEKAMTTNCHSNFWTVKAFLPRMITMNKGHIVTVASYLGLVAAANMEGYCASQFASVGFHEALSHLLKSRSIDNVKTTLVCPYKSNSGSFSGIRIRQDIELLVSSMCTEHGVKKAVTGVVTDQHTVFMPRLLYIVAILKHVVPWEVQLLFHKFLVTNSERTSDKMEAGSRMSSSK
ncbi:Hypothetical predicted protein [Pelobates cultripes]|uniref:Short-chain dehydrogenase/reductase 3 n=1 Tax=Pelobates cultripes TaxID=61616 RepID=A0AAD1SPR5_PELCU|nr:Hypothetical predicted protein [Pelobates cultripes]